jgi:lactoylglutathione lyase
MKEIVGINHIGIRVTSLERSRKFYEQLGFVLLTASTGAAHVAIMEHPSGVNINLIANADSETTDNILMDRPKKYPGYTHMALEVSNIDAIEIELKKLNIRITEGPVTLPNDGVMLFIRDQDGNVIEFHQRVTAQ